MRTILRSIVLFVAVLLLVQLALQASAIYSPFIIDSDIPERRCSQPTTVKVQLAAGGLPSIVSNVTELESFGPFAVEPDEFLPGIFLKHLKTEGCSFWFGHIPQSIHRSQVRRLGVKLRHVTEPIVLVSYLRRPVLDLTSGVLARASGTQFVSWQELTEHPRVLGSEGVSVMRREVEHYNGTLEIQMP